MLPGTFWCSIVVRVIIFSRLLVVNVNSDYSILVRVPSAPSRGSPTLWSMMSNVPTRTTTTQMICIAIIMLLKIRNGSISVRYPDYLNVTNGAIVIHTQRLKSDPGGNLLS